MLESENVGKGDKEVGETERRTERKGQAKKGGENTYANPQAPSTEGKWW